MKQLLLLCMLVAVTTGCSAQAGKQQKTTAEADTAARPKAGWKVNRKYDDKGNLVSYDSTYTWSYSGKTGAHIPVTVDSVMSAFRKRFDASFPAMFNNSMGNAMWNGSLFFKDFPRHDYFMKRYSENFFDMEGMMRSMDSVRNDFLHENYPGLRKM